MSLSADRCAFTSDVAKLIRFANDNGYACALDQVKRTAAEAVANAKAGTGIVNSLHCSGMAVDMLLYKGGVYLTRTEDYRPLGEYWQALSPRNRWGGDWDDDGVADKNDTDGNHFERRIG